MRTAFFVKSKLNHRDQIIVHISEQIGFSFAPSKSEKI